MVAKTIPVSDFDLVLFGATGDLSKRKILPGLFRRFQSGQMPRDAQIIGTARSDIDTDEFRNIIFSELSDDLQNDVNALTDLREFLKTIHYLKIDVSGNDGWETLKNKLRPSTIRAFYLSVSPSIFGVIARKLGDFDIKNDTSRIVVEKPYGHDLPSAQALNKELRQHFEENQIYRIDHYLGKETVQNLMALRFANNLFEQSWNAQHIDHVQITVSETLGVEGRGEYYDQSGALRDMVQNHLMQLLCLTAMEPPSRFEPNAVRDEKLKVIRSLAPLAADDIIRGQYQSRDADESYVDHAGDPQSRTESFVSMKVRVLNWRWSGTPFYLRTGKCMRERLSEIAIAFRKPPHSIFANKHQLHGNELVIRLQPNEGIKLMMTIKDPGPGGMRLLEAPLDMTFADAVGAVEQMPDAYERLIMDVIRGDQTLFMRDDELEAAWGWIDPIVKDWHEKRDRPFAYDVGSSGPEQSHMLIHQDGRRWRTIGA